MGFAEVALVMVEVAEEAGMIGIDGVQALMADVEAAALHHTVAGVPVLIGAEAQVHIAVGALPLTEEVWVTLQGDAVCVTAQRCPIYAFIGYPMKTATSNTTEYFNSAFKIALYRHSIFELSRPFASCVD